MVFAFSIIIDGFYRESEVSVSAITSDFMLFRAQQKARGLGWFASASEFKYFNRWRRYRSRELDTIANGIPWITFPSIRALESIVERGMNVFEYGSGGSTVFFLSRAGQVISVEHDKLWYQNVKNYVQASGLHWNGYLIEPEAERSDEGAVNEIYRSSGEEYRGYSFEKYAKSIDSYDDESFDIILLDGRARNGCYQASVKKLKLGGTIILDNAERLEYAYIEKDAKEKGYFIREFWGPGPYNDYFWRTIHIEKR